jgi:hypothetical protein
VVESLLIDLQSIAISHAVEKIISLVLVVPEKRRNIRALRSTLQSDHKQAGKKEISSHQK